MTLHSLYSSMWSTKVHYFLSLWSSSFKAILVSLPSEEQHHATFLWQVVTTILVGVICLVVLAFRARSREIEGVKFENATLKDSLKSREGKYIFSYLSLFIHRPLWGYRNGESYRSARGRLWNHESRVAVWPHKGCFHLPNSLWFNCQNAIKSWSVSLKLKLLMQKSIKTTLWTKSKSYEVRGVFFLYGLTFQRKTLLSRPWYHVLKILAQPLRKNCLRQSTQ